MPRWWERCYSKYCVRIRRPTNGERDSVCLGGGGGAAANTVSGSAVRIMENVIPCASVVGEVLQQILCQAEPSESTVDQ